MINISAIIQITILYLVFYSILKAAKGSRFGQVLLGVGIVAAAMFAFTFVFQFDVLSRIVKALLIYLAISTVVIFQPEIRRILSQVGAFGFLEKPKYDSSGAATVEFITDTIISLAERRTGALIAFERGISLRSYESSGVATDAIFSRELIESIFTPPLPLHDGGMIIRGARIAAAHCVFPISNSDSAVGGMRHRAAIGLSEETDALVVVVSEETGSVAVAHNGRIVRYGGDLKAAALHRWISKAVGARRSRKGLLAKLQEKIFKGAKK